MHAGFGERQTYAQSLDRPRSKRTIVTRSTVAAIVLAAGKGTRLRSDTAKVLHRVAGRSLVGHVLEAVRPLGLGQVIVVVGHQRDDVAAEVEAIDLPGTSCAVQDEQLGTGHAVEVALPSLAPGIDRVLVINGDAPLLTSATLAALADNAPDAATILTTVLDDATGYGRVLRDAAGTVIGVVEHADATDDERQIDEVNAGMYAFDARTLMGLLRRVGVGNEQGERYITDVVGLLVEDGAAVHGLAAPADDVAGVNDRAQLADAGSIVRRRHVRALQESGVTIVDPATTYIDVTVTVAPDATLLPGCVIEGATTIAEGSVVGPYSQLTDTTVAAGAVVRQSVCNGAVIGEDADVGPFTYLRPGAVLLRGAKTGAYVEVKQATIGEGSKVPHLSYVGDATLGSGVNFSCGAVTVNYDGFTKHQTVVEDGAFIGCDTMLVAPVTIGADAFIAAGSTITDDVPAGALGIGRGRQVVKDGWATAYREDHA